MGLRASQQTLEIPAAEVQLRIRASTIEVVGESIEVSERMLFRQAEADPRIIWKIALLGQKVRTGYHATFSRKDTMSAPQPAMQDDRRHPIVVAIIGSG